MKKDKKISSGASGKTGHQKQVHYSRGQTDPLGSLVNIYEEISLQLINSDDLHYVLPTVMRRIKEHLGVRAWIILLSDPSNSTLKFFDVSVRKKKSFRDISLKPGEGIAGWVLEKGRPVIVNDISEDGRFHDEASLHKTLETASLMCVPIPGKGTVAGVVELINKTEGEFSGDDIAFMARASGHIGLALEKASLYQKMTELAVTDDLTKLFNTRYLHRTIDVELERCNRSNTSVSLIFMDLDYFKNINDRYGHLVGSKVLVEVGQLLLKKLRSVDVVARYGGDEFVIVLPQTSLKFASQIAERLRRGIAETVFLKDSGYNIRITASFGVASYPERAKSKEELIRLADEAMFKVKYHTRNGVYVIV